MIWKRLGDVREEDKTWHASESGLQQELGHCVAFILRHLHSVSYCPWPCLYSSAWGNKVVKIKQNHCTITRQVIPTMQNISLASTTTLKFNCFVRRGEISLSHGRIIEAPMPMGSTQDAQPHPPGTTTSINTNTLPVKDATSGFTETNRQIASKLNVRHTRTIRHHRSSNNWHSSANMQRSQEVGKDTRCYEELVREGVIERQL